MTRRTHDHEIKIGSTTKQLNLVRDANKTPMYSVAEEPLPMAQQQDGMPPEKRLSFIQEDWMGGFGQGDFDTADMYAEGQSIDTTQKGRVFLGPKINSVGVSGGDLGANPVAFCWFPAIGKLMVAAGAKVFWYDGTNFVEKKDITGETITDLKVFAANLYVALGSSTKYYYSSDGANYTQTDLDDGYAEKFLVAPNATGTAEVLWKFKEPNEVANTTDGRTVGDGGAQWSSANYIGDTSNNITNLFLINDNLLIGREDGLYHLDTAGGAHALMPELQHNRSTNNFKYVANWQTGFYFSLGTRLREIVGYNTFDPMGPLDLDKLELIDKTGSVVGLASDNDWLYTIMDEGTNSIIYKGRERRVKEGLRWEWCPWVFLSTNACSTAYFCHHSTTDRRLWFGYGDNAGYVNVFDNPAAESSGDFAASGWFRTSYFDAGHRNWDKLLQHLVTQTSACTANLTIQPKYRRDAETSFTNLTAALTSNGTVKTDFTSALSCKRIQFEFDFATNDSTDSPELSLFQVRGILKPETIKIHDAVYSAAQTPSLKAETIIDFLRGGRTSTSLIRFADLRYGESTGASNYHWVVMEPGYPKETEVVHQKGKQPELGIRCRFVEIDYSGTVPSSSTDGTISSHIIPSVDDTYDLGSSTLGWRNVYMGGKSLARSTTFMVSGTNAPTHVKKQSDYDADDYASDGLAITAALDALTSDRTWVETVKCIGDFTVSSSIALDTSYTRLDLSEATITAAGDIDIISVTGSHIEIVRPRIDGQRDSYATRGIRVEDATNVIILLPYICDCLRQGIQYIHTSAEVDDGFILNPYISGCGSTSGEANIHIYKCIGTKVIGGRSTGNQADNGLYFAESYDCVASGIRLDNNTTNGVHSNSNVAGKGNILQGLTCDTNSDSGILSNYADEIAACKSYGNTEHGVAPGLRTRITGGQFSSNGGAGVYIYPGSETRYDVTVDGAEIRGNTGDGVQNYNGTHVTVAHSAIVGNGDRGIHEAGASDYNIYHDNEIIDNTTPGTFAGAHNSYDQTPMSVEMDLSDAAEDFLVYHAIVPCLVVSYQTVWTEAAGDANTCSIRVGEIEDDSTTDDDQFDIYTTAGNETLGQVTHKNGADMTDIIVDAGHSITVGHTQKTGAGKVRVTLQIMEMAS